MFELKELKSVKGNLLISNVTYKLFTSKTCPENYITSILTKDQKYEWKYQHDQNSKQYDYKL